MIAILKLIRVFRPTMKHIIARSLSSFSAESRQRETPERAFMIMAYGNAESQRRAVEYGGEA